MKIRKDFFSRSAGIVARELLGKILVRRINGKILKAMIIETEAYFDEKDPASWARFGKRKDNEHMWSPPGTILIKNVHKYFMLNFSTGKEGKAEAVLIRAVKPLNFSARCNGPGLLVSSLKIDKSFNGKNIFEMEDFWMEEFNEDFFSRHQFPSHLPDDASRQIASLCSESKTDNNLSKKDFVGNNELFLGGEFDNNLKKNRASGASEQSFRTLKIKSSHRIGVVKDLRKHLRFYLE